MSVKINTPQISALKLAVEQKSGLLLQTHNEFLQLISQIESAINDHMSETTLERLWGYSTRECTSISVRTLNVLSKFIGHVNWASFCASLALQSPVESEIFSGDTIDADALAIGTKLRIGWLPDRICIIEYLGGHRFIAVETHNSSIQPGDTFSCIQFQKGRELYLDKFFHVATGEESRYVVGQKAGLTTVEVIEKYL